MGNPDALFPNDVRRVVKTDHVHILALFHVYLVANTESRRGIVDQILHDLILHMSMEEDLLYPELTRSTDPGKKAAEKALLEHAEVKSMIHELQPRGNLHSWWMPQASCTSVIGPRSRPGPSARAQALVHSIYASYDVST